MRTIEYGSGWQANNSKVREVLYKKGADSTIHGVTPPSDIMLEVIKDAGWPTDWAFTLDHQYTGDWTDKLTGQPTRSDIFPKLEYALSAIFSAFESRIGGKRILDLGCGAKSSAFELDRPNSWTPGCFEPWLARLLHKLKAKVVGVDIGDLSGEKFEHHTLDLLDPNSLKKFSNYSFDLIHSSALYTSPELQLRAYGHANDGSLEAGWQLARVLKPQIERILKPKGIYLARENANYLINPNDPIYERSHSPLQFFE